MLRKVTIENGIIQGFSGGDPRITVFKGVPYAEPPVGALRWKAPCPKSDWVGVHKADTFPPMEVQTQPGTVGFRLNVFSFLAHPELTAENPDGCHANYGLEDIVFALKWIQRNIGAFGGDPSRVTIGGQSGGALGVISLCASPMAKGLVSGAIAQSGGGLRAFGYFQRLPCLSTAMHS